MFGHSETSPNGVRGGLAWACELMSHCSQPAAHGIPRLSILWRASTQLTQPKSEVIGFQTRFFSDLRKRCRANFFSVMEGEGVICPSGSLAVFGGSRPASL